MTKLTLKLTEGDNPSTYGPYVVLYSPSAKKTVSKGVGIFYPQEGDRPAAWLVYGPRGVVGSSKQTEAGRKTRVRHPTVHAYAKV